MTLGPYASFIIWSYALVAFVVIGLIAWIIADHRHQQTSLQKLEAEGMTRRSARKAGGA
ncbi:MAG: heme exporter protein CcmD [Afipia sp.]